MIGAVGALILFRRLQLDLRFYHISSYTPLIIVVYLVAMRAAFDYERRSRIRPPAEEVTEGITFRTALLRYLTAAAFVVAVGSWRPVIGQDVAAAMGWKPNCVGTLLIAGATSLPELVVVLMSRRLGGSRARD